MGGCTYSQSMVITEGVGTLLMRTDNDTADYKMVSVREIDVSTGPVKGAPPLNGSEQGGIYRVYGSRGFQTLLNGLDREGIPYAVLDLNGRKIQGTLKGGSFAIPAHTGNAIFDY